MPKSVRNSSINFDIIGLTRDEYQTIRNALHVYHASEFADSEEAQIADDLLENGGIPYVGQL